MTELKPCPFCGSSGIELKIDSGCVVCLYCEARGPLPILTMDDAKREADGIKAWNKRDDAKDTARIDWLETKRLRAGFYVDFDKRGASLRLDSSETSTARDAIDAAAGDEL